MVEVGKTHTKVLCTSCNNPGVFWKDKSKATGYDTICTTCRKAYKKKKYLKDKEDGKYLNTYRKHSIYNRYNITPEEYKRCMDTSPTCKICNSDTNLCYDHDHTTMKFRGVLCDTCNRAIGLLKDDVGVLESAVRYLKEVRDNQR